jgi:hypothetical protein
MVATKRLERMLLLLNEIDFKRYFNAKVLNRLVRAMCNAM